MVTFYTYLFVKCMLREQFELSEILHSNLKVFKIPFYFEINMVGSIISCFLLPPADPHRCPLFAELLLYAYMYMHKHIHFNTKWLFLSFSVHFVLQSAPNIWKQEDPTVGSGCYGNV